MQPMTRQQGLAKLNEIAEALEGRDDAAARAGLAALLDRVLRETREYLPWSARRAAKRQGLPYQNRLLQDELLDLCARYGEGRLALSYVVQELRDKGWTMPSRWCDQVDLFEDHGFKLVAGERKHAHYLALA